MDDTTPNEPQQEGPASPWPSHQVYYLTVDWLDAPHSPESPERLVQILRQAIEQAHMHGPDVPPARFTARVKYGDVASEVTGTVNLHHHHHA